MRLNFNILWVDDQPHLVDAQRRALQRVMAEEGFDLNPTFCQTVAEVKGQLADDIFRDEIDLILVDWDLGGGLKGETVISEIREDVPYKDIVFYSANADVGQLRKASFDAEQEGIYFVTRADLVEEVRQLFGSMIKKVLDLDHTRGIVMGATSDVDQMARECLQLAHDLLDGAGRANVLDEMVALLTKKVPDLQKRVDKLTGTPDVPNILKAHLTFTANDGLRILSRLLERAEFAAVKAHQPHVKLYIDKVVPKRNVLGHKVLSPEGKPAGIAGENVGEVISIDEMRELRRLLLELRGEFKLLHGALGQPNAA